MEAAQKTLNYFGNTGTTNEQQHQDQSPLSSMHIWFDDAKPEHIKSNIDLLGLTDDGFWALVSTRTLSNGLDVQGSHIDLLGYEELQPSLLADYIEWKALQPPPVFVPEPKTIASLEAITAAPSHPKQAEDIRGPVTAPLRNGPTEYTTNNTSPTNFSPAALDQALRKAVQAPSASITESEMSLQPVGSTAEQITVPRYVADISSGQSAREIVAHPDPADCQLLRIQDDDVETVKSDVHKYAKMLYDVLLAQGWTSAAIGDYIPDKKEPVVGERIKAKFDDQQSTAKAEMRGKTQTPGQLQRVRANCYLAVEAAIFVHEHGVLVGVMEKSKGNAGQRRSNNVDAISTCTQRLGKMVSAAKNHKLVAQDIMTGENHHKFAYHPDEYVVGKIECLKSNIQRPLRREREAEAKGLGKRGRKGTADGEDGASEEPGAKRTR